MGLRLGILVFFMILVRSVNAGVYAPSSCSSPNGYFCDTKWDVAVDGLYLRNDGSHKVNERERVRALTFRPQFGWGYRIEASYHFRKMNDVSVNWEHFNKISTGSNVGGNFTDHANIRYQSKFDMVNLEFAQRFEFQETLELRVFSGVHTLNITEAWAQFVKGRDKGFNHTDRNIESGVGPLIGADASYKLMHGVSIFARGGMAILSLKDKAFGSDRVKSHNVKRRETSFYMDADVDMALGVQYTHSFKQGDLSVRCTWENFIDIGAAKGENLAWNGVSVGAKWLGDI